MADLTTNITLTATVVLWLGLAAHFALRRGEAHRDLLWATAGIGVAIVLYLPPVARAAERIFGSSGPCDLAMNLWGVGSSALVLLAVAAGRRGRVAVIAVATAIIVLLALMGQTDPSPAGCVTTADVPWNSPFWILLITWHLIARTAALAACRRDAAAVRGDRWARTGIWWYTAGFTISTAYWLVLTIVLFTERSLPGLSTFANRGLFTATAVVFAVAVWWPLAHRIATWSRDAADFWTLYRLLPDRGWTAEDRGQLWEQSLRSWYRAPDRALYRLRIADADHRIDQSHQKGPQ